jgi:PAS domain S-box-containing protein
VIPLPASTSSLFIMQVVLLATIAIGFAGGLLAWRERPEPGAVPLTILLAGQCWWSATLFFRINETGLQGKVFWVDVSWVGVAILPVAWVFFCLAYTGYDTYLQPRYIVAASVIPVVTAVFGLTNGLHHFLYTDSTLVTQGGHLLLERTPGVWFWVIAAYTYLLGLLGAIPLLQFVSSDVHTFRGQSLALLVGLFVPWVTNALFLLGVLPTGGIDPTPVAFSFSALAFLGALTRFHLLGTSPAPIRPARRSVFDRMEGGVIVLDRKNNVVELNDTAAEALGAGPAGVLGSPVETIIPQFENLTGESSQSGQTVIRPGDGERTYDVSVTRLTDTHGRTAGRIVTLHDISEYLRQQQRLEVLNRLFRHNVRTNTQIIISQAEYLAEHNSKRRARTAQENALEIEEFSDKIRTILDVFERGRKAASPMRLETIINGCVETVRGAHPAVSIHLTSVPADVYVDSVMDEVLSNVIRNAAQHNTDPDPEVHVDVERDDDRVRITVSDNGPGIHDEELALLTEGAETPLHHGSGLGLALIVWGTEIIGGSVEFGENEPSGALVTLDVPLLTPGEETD